MKKQSIRWTITLMGIIGCTLLFFSCREKTPLPATLSDNPELPSVTVNGKQFHTETFGNPINPTVIAVHGGPGWDYESMLPLANLSDEYFVVLYDQSGCGLSPRYPKNKISLASSLDDLDALVDHFSNNRRVNLVGHGFGAMLVTAYLGQHPDKVAYAVLAEPQYLKPPITDTIPAAGLLCTNLLTQKASGTTPWDKIDREMLQTLKRPDNYFAQFTCNTTTFHGFPVKRPGALAAHTLMESIYHPDKGFFLDFTVGHQRFRNTVLLLFGECNPYFSEKKKNELRQSLNNKAIIKTIPHAGHFMFTDNPFSSIAFIKSYFHDTQMIQSN
ncbi:MAG: alpha/beta hydrolase, partial [Negativicutes bacterium]|nr:alpha/beta hydrolase [Negativicutes bacterium]